MQIYFHPNDKSTLSRMKVSVFPDPEFAKEGINDRCERDWFRSLCHNRTE